MPFNLARPDGIQRAVDIGLHLRFGQMIDLIVQLLRERGRRCPNISGGGEPATTISALGDMVRTDHDLGGRQPAGVELLDLEISQVGR